MRGPVSTRGPVPRGPVVSGPVPSGPVENVILVLLSKSLVFLLLYLVYHTDYNRSTTTFLFFCFFEKFVFPFL